MADVVVVGSINADLGIQVQRFPQPGETVPGQGGQFSPGGKGANQALAAALHGKQSGVTVAMVGAVGDDAAAGEALVLLRQGGVQLDAVRTEPGATGIAVVAVDAHGENQIVVVAGANAAMGAEAVREQQQLLADAAVVVLQGEIPVDGIAEAARLAAGRVVFNLAPVVPVSPEVLLAADPLVVNEHEAQAARDLLGGGDELSGDEHQLLATLEQLGCRSVVLTLGGRGALVRESGRTTEVAAPSVTAVDTTGAGDAFTGVLAAVLARGASLADAARSAAEFAAGTVQRAGAQASYLPS